jgi:hypothetical protein
MTTAVTPAVLSMSDTLTLTSLAIMPTLVLVILLIQRGLASSLNSKRAKLISQATSVAVVPLVFIFLIAIVTSAISAWGGPR